MCADTPLEGGIVYCKTNTNSIIGTGADIVSGTQVAGGNLRFDGADNSGMLFFPTTIVTTPTPTFFGSNPAEAAYMTNPARMDELAGAISDAVLEYLKGYDRRVASGGASGGNAPE